jgi:hypothetical protein
MAYQHRLRIPEASYEALQTLLALSHEQTQALAEALKQARPTFWTADFAKSVASTLEDVIDPSDVYDLVFLLGGLYVARTSGDHSIADFVEHVCEAMEESGEATLVPKGGDWSSFKERLIRLLDTDQSLAVTAKAADVMTQQAHSYCSARVITDLRPVFKTDPGEVPEAALVIHTLKITFHEGDKVNQFFVALDSKDVRDLRDLLDRAEQKERALAAVMSAAGLIDLAPEGN